ncbi:uncharacterized protein MICPUCDRAFT_55556 [Micromonas pusilla CCMP1545]|uniref:Predicted protein n=1 Tax=Micromonas pusilla (strain CCMP1545) TaxID=564608 RepID=C1ML30_MICPC|nr:uncharacterized protein MICPUCDRAFT_55556 [Micromonas pusilla CCMP1545]EEH59477.1 predicted protein [Micromonas pusilla CCMP1545]|eukprot:XP_003056101.1 predicted protein [Micromonas pusilla CCMP1545]
MDPFETLTAAQSPVDPFGTPPATPRPAADVADFINALWSRGGARGARHWSAEGATGGEHASAGGSCSLADGGVAGVRAERATGARTGGARVSAGGACSLADGGVAGVRAERATGAPKARRVERASAQAEHAGTRWSNRRSADNFTVQRSAPTGHLVHVGLHNYKNNYKNNYSYVHVYR